MAVEAGLECHIGGASWAGKCRRLAEIIPNTRSQHNLYSTLLPLVCALLFSLALEEEDMYTSRFPECLNFILSGNPLLCEKGVQHAEATCL